MADRLTNIEAGIGHAIEPIFHALPQGVQDFAREVVDPESQANVAALRNAAKGGKPIGSQQDLQDIQNANKALMPHIGDSLNIQAKDTNPRLKDTVGDVNQLTQNQNTQFGMSVAKVNKSLSSSWNPNDSTGNNDLLDLHNNFFNNAIAYLRDNAGTGADTSRKTNPAITKIFANRAATTDDTSPSLGQQAGGIFKMLMSPWLVAASTSEIAEGKLTGNEDTVNQGKASLGYRYGDPELSAHPETYSIPKAYLPYAEHQLAWDLFPVVTNEGSTLLRNYKLGKAGASLEEAVAGSTEAIKPVVNDVKSIVSSNPILKLHAADAGITDIANASEADLVDYMHQNPAAQTTILNNLKANKFAQADQLVASAKEAKAAGDIDSSVDLLQQAKDIKSDYNTFANQINRTAQWKLAGPRTLGQQGVDMIKNYYRMSPAGFNTMAKFGAVQGGVAAVAKATKNPTIQTAGGFITAPLETIMHLAGVNKNVVLANITQQYAKAYGMSVDDINNLPATDPFKAKIISAANTMYNQQTLTQTMGWTPGSWYGKIAASFLDTAVDLAGISIYTHLIPKVAGEQIKNIMNPLDKNGNVNIKVINAVEEQMKNAQSPQERQATLTAGLSTIEQMYKGKTISLATMTKAAKLLDLSIENIKSLVGVARESLGQSYGQNVIDQMYKLKAINDRALAGADPVQTSIDLSNGMKGLNEELMKMTETMSPMKDSPMFNDAIRQNVERAQMSMNLISHIKDSVGLVNGLNKTILKGLAPSYDTWSNKALDADYHQIYGTPVESIIRDAKNIIDGNKLNVAQAEVVKKYWKPDENGNYLQQDIHNAVGQKVEQYFQGVKELDEKTHTQVVATVTNVIENTIFQSFFVEHYKDPNLLAAADGKEAQLRDLSAISSQILSFLFTGKGIPSEQSALGRTLAKLQKGEAGGKDWLIKQVIAGASKFPGEVLTKLNGAVDTSITKQAQELAPLAETLRSTSSLMQSLAGMQDVIRLSDPTKSPLQILALGQPGAKEYLHIVKDGQEPFIADPKQDTFNQGLQRTADTLTDQRAVEDLTSPDFAKLLGLSTVSTSEYHGARIQAQQENNRVTDTAIDQASTLATSLENSTPGLTLPKVTVKKTGVELPLESIVKTMNPLTERWKLMMPDTIFNANYIRNSLGQEDYAIPPSLTAEQLAADATPSQLATSIQTLIGKDPGLVDFANIKPTLVPNKTIFEHAQTAKTPEEFAGKILADMGYPAEVGTHILMDKERFPGYANIGFDLAKKFKLYKDGHDVSAISHDFDVNYDPIAHTTTVVPSTAKDYPKYESYSDGLKNLGIDSPIVKTMKVFNVDYTPHLSYDSAKKDVPQNTLKAYNDILEQMKILNPDKVFLQTADDKMTLHAYDRNAIDEQAGKEGITFQNDANRAYYVNTKLGGIDKVFGSEYPKLFADTPASNELLAKLANNQQKYIPKITDGKNVLDTTNYGNALVLPDVGEFEDGIMFDFNKATENRKANSTPFQDKNHILSSTKIQSNLDGQGLKGVAREGNKFILKTHLETPESYQRAVEYIKANGGTIPANATPGDVADYLVDEMKINHVVLETSKKNFLKNISPTDLSKAGITLPENPESQFQLPIDKVRYYNVKGENNTNDISKELGRISNQSTQYMFGEYGDTFLNTLADYTSETNADVKKMLDAIANKDFDKLQTILESYGMSFAPGVDNVDANGNILDLGPDLMGRIKTVIQDQLLSKKIPGQYVTLAGVNSNIVDKINAEYPEMTKDGNWIVASRMKFSPDWKQGDPVFMNHFPMGGANSVIFPHVLFIEDLPLDVKPYFVTNENLPAGEIFASKKVATSMASDNDGDQSFIFPDLSKHPTADAIPLAEAMQPYQQLVDADQKDVTATKPKFADLQAIHGTDFHRQGPTVFAGLRQYSKTLTSYISSVGRAASILGWNIFNETPADVKSLIHNSNLGGENINAAVDGSLTKPWPELFSAVTAKGGLYDQGFPNLNKTKGDLGKLFKKSAQDIILKGKGGIFDYLGKNVEDTNKPVTLGDISTKTESSNTAFDKLLRLKVVDNLLGAGKVNEAEATKSLQGNGDTTAITAEMKRLKGIAKKDPKVQLNQVQDLVKAPYQTVINQMVNDYTQLGLATVLQNMGMPGDLPTKDLVTKKILTPGFELKGPNNITAFKKLLNDNRTNDYGRKLAITALELKLDPVTPVVQQKFPQKFINEYNIRAQQAQQSNGWTSLFNDAINTMGVGSDIDTQLFKNLPEGYNDYGNKKAQAGAYLLRGDTEGFQKFLAENQKLTVEPAKTRSDAAIEASIDKNAGSPTKIENPEQQNLIKNTVNKYFADLLDENQTTTFKDGTAPDIASARGGMYNLYKLINNSTPELVAQYANPIRDLQNEIAKTDPEAAQNPFLGEYIKQIYDNMNVHFAHQVSVEQPTVAPEIAQIKPYVNDQLKTMTKNIKGIKYNIQDSSSKISQQQFQQNLLGLYSTVNDLISKDPAYQKQMDDYMVRYTDQQIPADKAYALAMEDVNQDVIEGSKIAFSDETTKAIQDAAKSQLGTMGNIVSKMASTTAKLMIDISGKGVNIDRDAKYFKDKLDNTLLEQSYKANNGIDFLGSIVSTMNRIYKSVMVGASVGRRTLEMAGGAMNLAINGYLFHAADESSFLQRMGRTDPLQIKGLDFDTLTNFKELNGYRAKLFDQRKNFSDPVKKRRQESVSTWIGKIPDTTWKSYPSDLLRKFEGKYFRGEYFTALEKQIKFKEEQTPGYAEQAKRLLTTEDSSLTTEDSSLTPDERFIKANLLKETERIASKNTKNTFYNYAANPVFVAQLENYMPWMNFMFNSFKVLGKSSTSAMFWLGALRFTSNILQDFSKPQIDIDDQSLRGYYNVNRAALPILGMLGFSNVGFDINKALPIDVTNPSVFGYPYQKLFFPTQDPSYKRLLTDNSYHPIDYALDKIAPGIGNLIAPLTRNDRGAFARQLSYYSIGLSLKDTTSIDMVKNWYTKDYDALLAKGSYGLNQFNVWRSKNGQTPLTREDVQAYKYFQGNIFGTGKQDSKFDYLQLMADYIAREEIMPAKEGYMYKDVDAQKTIVKALKGLLTNTAVGLTRNQTDSLDTKANFMATNTIDKEGGTRPVKKGEKSILDLVKEQGSMSDFVDRLQRYAQNYSVLSQYDKADKDWNSTANAAVVGAFRYKFAEELSDPKMQKLEQENPAEYFKQKVDKITKGIYKNPVPYTPADTLNGSARQLTTMYQKYLELGQGKIMEDLNTSRATLNTLTILRDIQYDNLDKDPNHASYYWNQINKLTQQRNQEISRIDTLNPTLSNLNEVWGKAKAANYPESATAAYKKTQYKENTVQQNYLKGQQIYLKNLISYKNDASNFTKLNGITPEKLMAQYEGELQLLS